MAASAPSTAIARVRAELFSNMTAGQKTALVEQMCEESRELARSGIRGRHPDYAPDEIEHALHRLLVGDTLADKAWPDFKHLRP